MKRALILLATLGGVTVLGQCDFNCQSCESTYVCTACVDGFYLHDNECRLCDIDCPMCEDSELLLNELCVDECPTGFYIVDGSCVGFEVKRYVFDFLLNTIDAFMHDQSLNKFKARNGLEEAYYPAFDAHDPVPL